MDGHLAACKICELPFLPREAANRVACFLSACCKVSGLDQPKA